MAQLQRRYPGVLEYESRGSPHVVVDASLLGQKFGDEDLAALAPVSGEISVADFSGTAITDRSASLLAAMKQLRVLRLMHTKITDSTVEALGGLPVLESVSFFDTGVTAASLNALERLPKLAHVYVGETKISPDDPLSEAAKSKMVF